MELSDFGALSFDCYGTLIDWERGIAAVLGPWARMRGLGVSDEELLAAYAGQEARAEADHPADAYPAILARSMRGLGAALGAEVSDGDAQRLARSVPDWPAFPDSPPALAALATRYRLIILSNVDRESFAASQRRLGVTFTSVLTAQDIGSCKPSPRNFGALLAEAARLGVGMGGCCTSPRASSTTTSRPGRRGCLPSGSTGGMTGRAGGPPRRRPPGSHRTGSSLPWPRSRPLPCPPDARPARDPPGILLRAGATRTASGSTSDGHGARRQPAGGPS